MLSLRNLPWIAWLAFVVAIAAYAQDQAAGNSQPAVQKPAVSESSVEHHKKTVVIVKPDDAASDTLPPGTDPENTIGISLLKHLATDQKQFWLRPLKPDKAMATQFLPFVGFTGLLMRGDHWISQQVPDSPSQLKRSRDISNYGAYALAGAAGGAFLFGHITHNDHLREAGFLSGEAALNSTAIDFAFKEILRRQRPYQGDGTGKFFQGGSSFPSEHSAMAWSVASVMAHEYPGTLTKMMAYGLATAVTMTRVTSKEHFPSDVVVGSALGWYMGRQVYRAHHDPGLGGGPWGGLKEDRGEGRPKPENMSSPPVPLDSWVYPAMDRLIALGYVKSAYAGQRPWTRIQCARFLEEVSERLSDDDSLGNEGPRLYRELASEFAPETRRMDGGQNYGIGIDSIYGRVTGISGTPLRDGYHFAQTIINDYGRPYAEGVNAYAGMTIHGEVGLFSFSAHGEYQHAPSTPSYSSNVLQAIAAKDATGVLSNGSGTVDRLRLLDGTVAFTWHNTQFSFGKENLWLGPGAGGPLLFSDNAEPVMMFRVNPLTSTHIPGLSRILGPFQTEFFLGQLAGQSWEFSNGTLYGPGLNTQPFIHGEKISFKPSANLEIGFGLSVLWGGPGNPITFRNFFKTFSTANAQDASPGRPGDRRSTFDVSYRMPHFRDWWTVYLDSLVEDEASPVESPHPNMRLGMYFPKLPKINKLDLRLEGVYTDVPGASHPSSTYFNFRFRSGYNNDGNLIGSWIGREGRGGQAWATYWISPRTSVQLSYRHMEVGKDYLEGGRLNDFGANLQLKLRHDLSLSAVMQYETWKFSLLSPQGKSNFTSTVQLTFWPHWRTGN